MKKQKHVHEHSSGWCSTVRIKCKILHCQVRTVTTGSCCSLRPSCNPELQERRPRGTNRPFWPCLAPPGACHTPAMAQDPISAQPGIISPCAGGTMGVPVSSHAPQMDCLNVCSSLSPVVSLVSSPSAPAWAPWMASGPGSSPTMLGAVDRPHCQPPVLHPASAPAGWFPQCPNRLDKDPTESPRNAQLCSYPDTEIKQ